MSDVNTEGEPIRIKPDEMMVKHDAWAAGERKDKQNSATRREAIKSFVEGSGLHPKAFSQVRALLKIEDKDKRNHALRTLKACFPIIEASLEDDPDLGLDEPAENVTRLETVARQANDDLDDVEAAEAAVDADPDLSEDASDFDDALAEVAEG